jgi:hypothetical protein
MLGMRNFSTLVVLSSYMNKKGECYPSIRELSNTLGVSTNSVNKYIKELLEFRINGKPLIIRHFSSGARGKRSIYKIMPESQMAIFNQEIEKIEPSDLQKEKETFNARAALLYFCEKYEEKYGSNYSPNWGKDTALIKNKLISEYTEEQIKNSIDIVMKNYEMMWRNINFPRPTIAGLCSFLMNAALALQEESQQKEKELQQKLENVEKQEEDMKKLVENENLF